MPAADPRREAGGESPGAQEGDMGRRIQSGELRAAPRFGIEAISRLDPAHAKLAVGVLWVGLALCAAHYWLSDTTKTAFLTAIFCLLVPSDWILRFRKVAVASIKYGPKTIKHAPELLPHWPELMPHVVQLIDNIDVLGAHLDVLMKHKAALFPHLPLLMSRFDQLLPHVDKLVSKADFLVANIDILLPHMDEVLPYIDDVWPYVDDLEPHVNQLCEVFEVQGWEDLLPYMDQVVPYIKLIAPHSHELLKNYDPLREHIPILVRNLDTLALNIDETVEVIERLVPLLGLLPLADKLKLLRSKKICKALPKIARILPKGKREKERVSASRESLPNGEQQSYPSE